MRYTVAMTLVIIFAILAVLFSLAYATKRRFGVLGLGLAAGVVLSQHATSLLSPLLESWALPVAPLSFSAAASIILTMTPALVLLIAGPTYHSQKSTIIGAVGFALLGTFFIPGPLSAALPISDTTTRDSLLIISRWQNSIVVIAIVLALIDTMLIHGLRSHGGKQTKHGKH